MSDWFSAGDASKFAIFGLGCLGFYVLARWSSSHSDSAQPFQQAPLPEPDPLPQPYPVSDEERSVERVVPSTKNRTVSLKDIWFDTFDVQTGPPDPKRFCAEMTVTIDLSDNHERSWESRFPVATPEGMREKMQREHWSTMYLPEVIVVDHYDIEQICEAVIDRVLGDDPDANPGPDDSSLDSVRP